MKSLPWYVIQVQTGKEDATCEVIMRACEMAYEASLRQHKVLNECFCPRYIYEHKRQGAWVEEEMLLLPGYVIAVTGDPWELARILRGTMEFTRLLKTGKTFTPLNEDEKSWLERWTTEGNRTIPMSTAYKVGDTIVITQGPLVGQEAMITRVNRRKSVAHLEIHAGSVTIRTTVGLSVLSSKPEGN